MCLDAFKVAVSKSGIEDVVTETSLRLFTSPNVLDIVERICEEKFDDFKLKNSKVTHKLTLNRGMPRKRQA